MKGTSTWSINPTPVPHASHQSHTRDLDITLARVAELRALLAAEIVPLRERLASRTETETHPSLEQLLLTRSVVSDRISRCFNEGGGLKLRLLSYQSAALAVEQ